MLLVQIAGGLFGFGIAYAMHRFVERPYERSTAEARIRYEEEMAILKQKQQSIKQQTKLGAKK